MSDMPGTGSPDHERPLAGIRVIDLCSGPMAFAGRNLAELGADVLHVTDGSRDASRETGYHFHGLDLLAFGNDLGKRTARIDGRDPAERAWLEEVIAGADVLIEDFEAGPATSPLVDVDIIRARHPALVLLSISDFGRFGSFRHWQGSELVFSAINGVLSRSGVPGQPPLQPPGDISYACAAAQAVCVVLAALYSRLRGGPGDMLDLSLLDASTQVFDPGYGIAGSATLGVPPSKLPRGRIDASFQYPVIACADGHVRLCVLAPRQWRGMFEWMGSPAEFADPQFNKTANRFASKTLIPAIGRFFADKTRAEIEAEAKQFGVPAAALYDFEDVLSNEHIAARKALASIEVAPGIEASFPQGAWEIDRRRCTIGNMVADPITAATRPDQVWPLPRRQASPAPGHDPARPLAGLRVLDLGVIVVGAEQGRFFGDLGADVIKVETSAFPDGSRQTMDGSLISMTFAAGHRNKRSLGLNLRDPAGKALFLSLVEKADVIFSNFKPGTLDALGFDHDSLAAINPRIITADSSAFGTTGPWSARMGYGPLVRAASGLAANWRYPGMADSFSDGLTVYPDHVAGRYGIAAVLALLVRRLFTGRGGQASASQLEITQGHLTPQIVARSLELQGHALDRDRPRTDAPWGMFACAGDDEWCAVTVDGHAQWLDLCTAIERPDMASDPGLTTAAGRDANRDWIDAALRAWLASRSAVAAMEELQSAGVAAGAMLRVFELPDSPLYAERGLFRLTDHPRIAESFYLETGPVRSAVMAPPPTRPAPVLGEHTDEVVAEWLGIDKTELARLHATNVLETTLPAPAAAA